MNIISNILLGFSSNSSSTHSIILFTGDELPKEEWNDKYFGWDYFTISTKETKILYLESCLYQTFNGLYGYGSYLCNILLKEFCPNLYKHLGEDESSYSGLVDHQSEITFPLNDDGEVDLDFYNSFKDYLLSNHNLIIIGGNDNDKIKHPLNKYTVDTIYSKLPIESDNSYIVRYDKVYDYYTLFNKNTGNRIRLNFNKDTEIIKASVPDLVDIKITDYCDKGCTFCYQSSTTEGKSALLYYINSIYSALSYSGVFEVVLGGGEPTSHPEFLNILKSAKDKNLVPSFTTKSFKWFKNYKSYLNLCGCFGFSISTVKEAIKLVNSIDSWDYEYRNKCTVHLVLGTLTRKQFVDILNVLKGNIRNILLLGYKPVGFGETYKVKDYSWWLNEVENKKYDFQWKIDTAIVAEFEEQLSKITNKEFYYSSEGSFSCYIDAVNKTMSPSSYCSLDKYTDLSEFNFYRDKFLNIFATY